MSSNNHRGGREEHTHKKNDPTTTKMKMTPVCVWSVMFETHHFSFCKSSSWFDTFSYFDEDSRKPYTYYVHSSSIRRLAISGRSNHTLIYPNTVEW
mmetsp:Transcript_5726/g.8839  ORF Transcript_5726/g.8839 Transcript_5726/m.8839 type:complete len:96 (-) Transcript_5726:635-922(-)